RATFSSRAYRSTRRWRARMLAMTVPKLPAPTTPTGLSDELFEVIPHEPVVIVVEHVEVLRHDVPFLVSQQWALEVENAHVFQSATNHQVGLTFEMRGVVQ